MSTVDKLIELDDISGMLSYAELLLGVDGEAREDCSRILKRTLFALGEFQPMEIGNVEQAKAAIQSARTVIRKRRQALKATEDFVPAAEWNSEFRGILFEHLRVEMETLWGAIRVEPLWMSFGQLQVTDPIQRLCLTGGRTIHRAVGEFLVGSSGSYSDQAAARDFFPDDGWETIRSEGVAESVLRSMRLTNKQVAHLTSTRPLPEDYYVYAPQSLGPEVEGLMTLLREFTSAAPAALLPAWWGDWLPADDDDLYNEPS
jgi:hypothetical protein